MIDDVVFLCVSLFELKQVMERIIENMRDFEAGWIAQAFAGISEFIGRITRCFLNCFGNKNMCEKKELSPQNFWFCASA